jgi:ligand-binding sensor domain-containing protein
MIPKQATAQSWESINYPGEDYGRTVFSLNKDIIILGTVNGFQRTTNAGYSWETITTYKLTGNVYRITESDNGNLLAACDNGIFQSRDKGKTWSNIYEDDFVLAIDTDEYSNIYAVTIDKHIYEPSVIKSTNGGYSWTDITPEIMNMSSIDFKAISNDLLLLSTGASLFYSEDGGMTWVEQKSGYEKISFRSIACGTGIHFGSSSRTWGFTGMFKSYNGVIWNKMNTYPEDLMFSFLRYDSKTGTLLGYSGQNKLYRLDENNVWNYFGVGLPEGTILLDLVFTEDNSIYALGTSRQLFKLNLNTSKVEEEDNSDIVLYPNPANDLLSVISSNPINSMEIIDITGTVVFKSDNTLYENEIDLSSISPGVYFLKTESDSGISIERFIIER